MGPPSRHAWDHPGRSRAGCGTPHQGSRGPEVRSGVSGGGSVRGAGGPAADGPGPRPARDRTTDRDRSQDRCAAMWRRRGTRASTRAAGLERLDDALHRRGLSSAVRPARPGGHGQPWAALDERRDKLRSLAQGRSAADQDRDLLAREGVRRAVPDAAPVRADELGFGRRAPTVRVADGKPGRWSARSTSARLGSDPGSGRRGAGGSCTAWSSPRCTAATCSCG